MSTDWMSRHDWVEPLSLPELLRKCHRDELMPLCGALKVNPDGIGLSRLAEIVAWTLRRAGGNEIGNVVLRKGEGPPYPEVLGRLCKRCGVEPVRDVEATELRLLEWWMAQAWDKLDPEQRARLWAGLEQTGDPPSNGRDAAVLAREALGRGFGYELGLFAQSGMRQAAGLMLLPLINALGPIATFWYLSRPRDEVLLPAVLEVSRLRQTLRFRVTVGVVGSPSCGKDAAIKAIFGIDSGNIDPVAGSTREVSISRLPGATALYVVNTPGLGDVVQSVTEEARQVLDHIDVYVYVLNSQGGVQARELADWRGCVASGRPALVVVNKIDTLRERDRERYLADARAKLQAPEPDFLAAAFDPLPQLADHPLGVDAVRTWLERQLLSLGKDPGELPWRPEPPAVEHPAGVTRVPGE